jgi:hypothetical protein
MVIRNMLASIAAVSLVAAPVAAQAAPRTSAEVEGEQLAGNPWIPFAVGLIVAVIILLVVFDDDDAESP